MSLEAFTLYKELLDKLHALELASSFSEEGYDAIVDSMDWPWENMTGEEQVRARLYSSQLNRRCDELQQQKQEGKAP